ncbi:MAG: hypothetical protein U0414_38030 [Polyangiaceae bacterium]
MHEDEPAQDDHAIRWAAALLSELVESGGVEIVSEEELLASGIVEALATELTRGPDDLGERVLGVLLESDGVDEVFTSERALIPLLGSSRPAS